MANIYELLKKEKEKAEIIKNSPTTLGASEGALTVGKNVENLLLPPSSGPFCEGYPPRPAPPDGSNIRKKHKSEDASHGLSIYSDPNQPDLSVQRQHLPVYLYPLETIDSPQTSSTRNKLLINEGLFCPLPDENNIKEFVSSLDGDVVRRRDPLAIVQHLGRLRNDMEEDSAPLRADIFRICCGRHWTYRNPGPSREGHELLFSEYILSQPTLEHEINFVVSFLDATFQGYDAPNQQYSERLLINLNGFEGVLGDPSAFKPARIANLATIDISDKLRKMVPEHKLYALYFYGKKPVSNFSVPSSEFTGPLAEIPGGVPVKPFVDKLGLFPVLGLSNIYYDFVHSTEIPFYQNEASLLGYNQFSTIDIRVVTNSTFYKRESHWATYKNIYRTHEQLRKSENSKLEFRNKEPCNVEDNILLFPSAQVESFEEVAKKTSMYFPQHVEFDIHTQQGSAFAAMASLTRMDKYFLDLIANPRGIYDKHRIREPYRETMDEETQNSEKASLNDRFISDPKMLDTYDIISFISEMDKDVIEQVYERKDMFPMGLNPPRRSEFSLGEEEEENATLDGFWDLINKNVFVSKLYKFITPEKIRRFKDIWNGELAYSETVAYKVCKYDFHEDGLPNSTPLQEFVFFDNENITNFKFIDNQVLYGEKYHYRIFAYNIVIGSEYKYEGSYNKNHGKYEIDGFRDRRTNVTVTTKPKIVLVQVPYFEKTLETRDRPPMFPDVSFLPYKGIDTEVGIVLTTNYGEYNSVPVKVLDTDEQIIERMVLASNPDIDGRILYKGDSPPSAYQIFRLEDPPDSYSDFARAKIYNVTYPRNIRNERIFNLPQETYIKGKGLIHDNQIEPNKDYYYMFRSSDPAGISNPSRVFKIRLISYEDGVYLDVKPHSFSKRKKMIKGDLSQFLEIEPSAMQSSYALNLNSDPREAYKSCPPAGEIRLGLSESSIWGKYYKLRIRSKVTGKVLDVNFKFNYKIHENLETAEPDGYTPEDEPCPPRSKVSNSSSGLPNKGADSAKSYTGHSGWGIWQGKSTSKAKPKGDRYQGIDFDPRPPKGYK